MVSEDEAFEAQDAVCTAQQRHAGRKKRDFDKTEIKKGDHCTSASYGTQHQRSAGSRGGPGEGVKEGERQMTEKVRCKIPEARSKRLRETKIKGQRDATQRTRGGGSKAVGEAREWGFWRRPCLQRPGSQ